MRKEMNMKTNDRKGVALFVVGTFTKESYLKVGELRCISSI